MNIKLTNEQIDFLKIGTVISVDGEKWYYLPFWVKEVDGKYELVNVENLPQYIQETLKERRERDSK